MATERFEKVPCCATSDAWGHFRVNKGRSSCQRIAKRQKYDLQSEFSKSGAKSAKAEPAVTDTKSGAFTAKAEQVVSPAIDIHSHRKYTF